MNSSQNSTAVPDGATVIQDMIDKRDGILSQSIRAKHLSRILMSDIEDAFSHNRIRQVDGETLTFLFRQDSIDTTLWLMSELWDAALNIADQIDALSGVVDDLVEAGK